MRVPPSPWRLPSLFHVPPCFLLCLKASNSSSSVTSSWLGAGRRVPTVSWRQPHCGALHAGERVCLRTQLEESAGLEAAAPQRRHASLCLSYPHFRIALFLFYSKYMSKSLRCCCRWCCFSSLFSRNWGLIEVFEAEIEVRRGRSGFFLSLLIYFIYLFTYYGSCWGLVCSKGK